MDWLSVLPPLVAIIIVIWKKEVILALLTAVFTSELLLASQEHSNVIFHAFIGSLERVIGVVSSAGNARILIFSLLIGALLAYVRDSGGVTATVEKLVNKGIAKSKRQVGALTMFTGMVIFIESNLSVLTAGILSRDLFDKFKMSRARLAYIIDSTSAPVCILVLLNGWGAYVLALLNNYELGQSSVSILWGSVAFNFYAIIALLMVVYTVVTDRVHGPMKTAELALNTSEKTKERVESDDLSQRSSIAESSIVQTAAPQETLSQAILHEAMVPATKARFMLVPLMSMIFGMFFFMYWSGNGDITQGDGSKSVLYATCLGLAVSYFLLRFSNRFGHQELVEIGFKGIGELLPLVTIVLLSLTLGASLKELGTGYFIAGIVGEYLPLILVVPMLFIAGAIISFSTGTSWGTFAILIPIGVPLIQALGLPPSLVIAAILGGGIFGDHCSPISDTTCVSAIASGCDLLEHVKTQMPYALFGGALTLVAYIIASIVMI
ncbi:Na+/H+ antiporter NhaC family protein [Colwellia psychrerythraea]|jgi:Na+/H+ antiporter NhaC|uniref:Na+/H+ antiporter family protein n=1 Tax=Colwellia psychrerythraea (strain 34H / ATCC BAA-681) TaxID=167879 RepID=Q47V05_COLP3|nr:Na+/H+ antiporter NhaC family protein [Colwellia psychrerythraea]AAZ26432.1 Na+/H+ antiporter family protein [Colwellia psychrerythraea 34H]